MTIKKVKLLAVLVCVSLLSACAGTYRTYYEMFKLALSTPEDVSLTYSAIAEAPYDFMYLRQGEKPRVALALAFIEQQQFKWVSGEQEMVVTESGRIVRTLGLGNDLLFLSNRQADPLKQGAFRGTQWRTAADRQLGEYGTELRSTFSEHHNYQLTYFNHVLPTVLVIEQVAIDTKPRFWRFDGSWQNLYWLDAETGRVLQSRQQLAAGQASYELVYVSEVVRALKRRGLAVAGDEQL